MGEALGVSPATCYRHASGDDTDGSCLACIEEPCPDVGGVCPGVHPVCRAAVPDPAEPGLCRWCSHTVEPVGAAASLPCSGCESSPCVCPG